MIGAERTVQSVDEAQIRQMMVEQVSAMQTRDAQRLVSRYAAEIVQFDLAPPLQQAGPQVLEPSRLIRWFSGFEGSIDFEVRDLSITVGEDVAFCHSVNRLSATPRGLVPDEGKRAAAAAAGREAHVFDLWFRATVCLCKVDGTWKIVHEHKSTPFYMDGSFRAAVDLEP